MNTYTVHKFSDGQLRGGKKNLEHAKAHRPGGLMNSEQAALDNITAELERRADVAYCKAHDC